MTEPDSPLTDPLSGKSPVTPAQETPWSEQELQQQSPTKTFDLGEGPEATKGVEQPSPMELSAGQPAGEVTPEVLNQQALTVADKAGSLQQELTQDRFDALTPGQKTLLHGKLTQFSEHVKGLSDHLGIPYEAPKADTGLEQLKPFLEFLTQGQHQIRTAASSMVDASKGKVSVTQMMRTQAKLMAADRAINFASAVVAKGVDFLKQIMSTQV